ncbi:MAG: inositol monophosphatase [Pseudomonadales bacterium]|jgi:myo-inositol-1(or 4)-monophosphatase|uniref:Inositol-1-monophosphatase n=1 Tax=Halopseudomonas pachastrellae TaxID=254161 RepID=A0A1S8DGU9_9GAMM|nr:inositol-phosphate phosphatase [Halopseudomonas pachastrellae]MAP29496.1 inositol monophosphatase [Pseudomonas sp.]MBB50445.1 inositol monophosphatase [Pseudomonadales bacterium]MAQ49593.1 inositol monophosphatase [Pseudomonas sp.]MBP76190.1 inositol monophosphatase [Pseudomonadales bacterium]MBU30662.1 inositol monophosphatase [Pseudomonadales bacterium]|tara:strand:- start:103 stop:918 length:816 start_codon:yes stop_codon:yes gene_type:complete
MQPMLNIALRAARSAGELIYRSMERLDVLTVDEKDARDYVSEVDRAAEQAIISQLRKAYPDHSIQAEESGFQPGHGEGADTVWIIDPLDGTTNFIRGVPHFAVSIACRVKGRIEHAVVLDPIRQEEFTASRGRGAALNGRRLRVSTRKTLDGALLGTGFPFRANQIDSLDNYLGMFRSLVGQTAGIRRAGAASLDLAYVAAGRFDAFWEFGLAEWDMAAGALLIQEAGGLCSDFSGGHQFLEKGQIVAGNPKCFKAVLTAIQPHLTPSMKM